MLGVRKWVFKVERAEYLQMCQKCSVLKSKCCRIKENVPDDLKVIYNGTIYYPVAYELSFKNGKTQHTAVLHDLKSNSVTYADLSKVDKVLKL